MANKTVYPYGQNGQLPSGYPIADDMDTFSAQEALSAKQGAIIKPYIIGGYSIVDLSGYTVYDGSLGSSPTWYMSGKHITIPVTPGQSIKIRPTGLNGHDGGLWGFLNSNHHDPVTNSTNIAYANETSRKWAYSGVIEEITVPSDAHFLCLCVKDGAGETSWEMWLGFSKSLLVNRSEIVNNLTYGGTDVPLSAEQGKILADHLFPQIPSGLTKQEYTGASVKVSEDKHYVATKQVSTITSIACQGGACFGDYLFMFTENNTTCWVYNLATNTLLQTITIPSSERGFVSNCHCNTVNFGTEYYDANDPFPLIYVSTGYASGEYTGALVYRIVATTENDVTTYSLVLVQTLKMPGTEWTEFLTGEDGFCYLCYTSQRKIYRMKMPKLSDGDVTFDLGQALSAYQFTPQPSWYNGSQNQNRFYKNGKIYMVSGGPPQTTLFIVLDLATERREVEIDLLNTLGLSGEPETCFIWQDHICIVFRSKTQVYALYFE